MKKAIRDRMDPYASPPLSKDIFSNLRYGLFVTYGLYSLLERGEWVMNRERISPEVMRKLAADFTAEAFDADSICELAVRSGMRYICLTSMHHEGFRLYKTKLSDFNSWQFCRRDLVDEIIRAACKRGLYVAIYHSLNNWSADPDGVRALEDEAAKEQFVADAHARIEELVRNYSFDILWYDGWWPFDGTGWRGDEMNAMCRKIRPNLLFNPRNGADGDFVTPEQHMSAPIPWQPWEACMTLNDNWGYHSGDDNWKSPKEIVKLLCKAAAGKGNLLLNVGPRGDGSIPQEARKILEIVGEWKQLCGEALEETELFNFNLEERGQCRGDWHHHGPMTAKGKNLYLTLTSRPNREWTFAGLEQKVISAELLPGGHSLSFEQINGLVHFKGLPDVASDCLVPVIKLTCDACPSVYNCGGMQIPSVRHPPYDPLPSDISH